MSGKQKTPLVYTELTPMDRRAIDAITPGVVRYPVGAPQKRFAREVQSATKLTDSQRKFLWRVAWWYRRQIADTEVVEHAGKLREWAMARYPLEASVPSVDACEAPSQSLEPTDDDVASLPGLFDDMETQERARAIRQELMPVRRKA